MAKIYDLAQIKQIHRDKQAANGVIYQTIDRYFKGTVEGYLDEVTDITFIDNNITNITNNTADITALVAEDARLESVKADKCFALAMSIIL